MRAGGPKDWRKLMGKAQLPDTALWDVTATSTWLFSQKMMVRGEVFAVEEGTVKSECC